MDWSDFGLKAAELLLPLLVAGLSWAAAKGAQWLASKTKNELVQGLIVRLNDSVWTVVKHIEQTTVKGIKSARSPDSPGGVKITQAEADAIKEQALKALQNYWGEPGLKELGKVFGLDPKNVNTLLTSKIEAAVHDISEAKKKEDPTRP